MAHYRNILLTGKVIYLQVFVVKWFLFNVYVYLARLFLMPSSSTASLVSGRLLLRSLGTIDFRDVAETIGREIVPVTSPRSVWLLMTAHTERERGLVTMQP